MTSFVWFVCDNWWNWGTEEFCKKSLVRNQLWPISYGSEIRSDTEENIHRSI